MYTSKLTNSFMPYRILFGFGFLALQYIINMIVCMQYSILQFSIFFQDLVSSISICALLSVSLYYLNDGNKTLKSIRQSKLYDRENETISVDGFIFVGYKFSWSSWRVRSTNSSTHELAIFCMKYQGKWP